MTYTSGNHYDFGAAGWDVEEGKMMLSNHHNNCYGYAGAFCALARDWKNAIFRGMNYAPPPQAGNVTTRSEDIKVGYKVHAPMSPSKRAKQFVPFDALKGLKEALEAQYPDAAFALEMANNLSTGDNEQNAIHQRAYLAILHGESIAAVQYR